LSILTALFTDKPQVRRAAAISGIAGSILTRYRWMSAGRTSARDRKLPLKIPDKQTPETNPLMERVVDQISAEKIG
jgi:hypothetical protein